MESILPNFFFSVFFFFGVKLGHFTINNFFLYVTKTQAYQQKTEKFFISEEKSLVGSTPVLFYLLVLLVLLRYRQHLSPLIKAIILSLGDIKNKIFSPSQNRGVIFEASHP